MEIKCGNLHIVFKKMGSYSIGEALNQVLEKSHWKPKIIELRIKQEWEAIVGNTISKYTRNTTLYNKVLTVYTDVAPLKQELLLGKEQLATRINEYFNERVVEEIVIK
jgi:predicted nucleic acid-binding Zn ribbon protein